MKELLGKMILALATIMMAVTGAKSQVEANEALLIVDKEGERSMLAEGGNWKITFSDTDSLGRTYGAPVSVVFEGSLYNSNTHIPIENIDSIGFLLPADEMKAGVFEITEEQFKYILSNDSTDGIAFRIDCMTKTKMPKIGQKVVCHIFRDPLPGGIVGQVKSMKIDPAAGVVRMKCDTLDIAEIYDVFYKALLDPTVEYDVEVPQEVVATRSVVKHATKPTTRGNDYNLIEKIYYLKKDFSVSEEKDEDAVACFKLLGNANITPVGYIVVDGNKISVGGGGGSSSQSDGVSDFCVAAEFDISVTVEYDHWGELKKSFDWWLEKKSPGSNLLEDKPLVSKHVGYGCFVNFYAGMYLELALKAMLNVSTGAKLKVKIGLERKNGLWDYIYEEGDNGLNAVSLQEPKLKDGYLFLEGSAFLAVQFKLGIGVLYDLAEILGNFGLGPRVKGRITYHQGQQEEYCKEDKPWLDRRTDFYTNINDSTNVKLDLGIIRDAVFTIRNPFDELKKETATLSGIFGFEKASYINLYTWNAAPDTREISDRKLNEEKGTYSGKLKNEHDILLGYKAGMMFLDEKRLGDGVKEYYDEELGEFKRFDDNDVSFNYDLSNRYELKGRLIGVYPTLYNKLFTGYMVMGKLDEIYIPYVVKMTKCKKGYDDCEIAGEFDKEALANENMKESGFLIYKPGTPDPEDALYKLPYEYGRVTDNTMEMVLERSDIEVEEFDVRAYLYDGTTGRYMYSSSWRGGFNDHYKPETLEPEEITAVGAVLKGSVHDDVVAHEGIDHMTTQFNVGFVCNPGNLKDSRALDKKPNQSDAMQVNVSQFSWNVEPQLDPNKEYAYQATVYDNLNKKEYKGEIVRFKTKPVFHDFKVEPTAGEATLMVFVDYGFADATMKQNYRFIVSERRDVWEDNPSAEVVNENDMKSREEYFFDKTLVRIIDLADSDFGRDPGEEKQDYDLTFGTTKGWVPGRTYYAKAVFLGNSRWKRVESEIIEFKIPAPIDNLISMPEADECRMNADVLFPYANGNARIFTEYSKNEIDIHNEVALEFEAGKVASWRHKDAYIEGMEYTLPNLEPSTKYFYRYRVEKTVDGVTTVYRSELSDFTTKKLEYKISIEKPIVEKNNATLRGDVNKLLYDLLDESLGYLPNEDLRMRMVHFEVSRNKDMSAPIMIYVKFEEERIWEIKLNNLDWDTKFYCRIVAQTADMKKTFKSTVKDFTVAPEPAENFSVTTFDAVLDDEWTTLKGKVNSTILEALNDNIYGEMIFGFEYAPTESDLLNGTSAVIRDTDVALNKSTGLFTRVLQLKPNTTHHCRAFVYFAGKFVYGNIVDFTTADYDAGLIIPDMEAAMARALKAIMLEDGNVDKVIFIEDGKMVVPSRERVQRMLKME